jgi:hypothetical protein
LKFVLKVPVSLFFVGKEISTEKLSELMKSNKLTSTTSNSHKFTTKQDFSTVSQEIASTLGISIVGVSI